jgi:hypothetical protein
MRLTRYVPHRIERRGVYRVLVGKYGGKRPRETPMRRWKNNIKMDLQVVGYGVIEWIDMD